MSREHDRSKTDFGFEHGEERRRGRGRLVGDRTPGKRRLTDQIQLRRRTNGASDATHEDARWTAAERGVVGAGGSLPHLGTIQRSFGPDHDLSRIVAHVGGAAVDATDAIGAEAYAIGSHVAFRQAPDLHTAAHEAAHVIQQAQGVSLYGGVGEAGDVYERHADAVADRVVRGQSADDLLTTHPIGGGRAHAVQRKVAAQRGGQLGMAHTSETLHQDALSAGVTELPNQDVLAAQALSFVGKAFTAFLDACGEVKEMVERRLAKPDSSGGLFSLLFDVMAGLLLPGLAGKITDTFITTLFPPKASYEAHAIGLRLLESGTIATLVSTVVGKAKGAASSAWDALVEKSGGARSADAFFRWLKDNADATTGELLTTIPQLPPDQLIAVYLAYHPSLNAMPQMRERISTLLGQYEEQVEPMRQWTDRAGNMAYNDLHQIKAFVVVMKAGPPRLALLERTRMILSATGEEIDTMPGVPGMYPDVPVRATYRFKAWIDSEMTELAIQQTAELGGAKVVLADEVQDLQDDRTR